LQRLKIKSSKKSIIDQQQSLTQYDMKFNIVPRIKTALKVLKNGLPITKGIFRPYVIKTTFENLEFNFLVTDEDSKSWYGRSNHDGSPELIMLSRMTKPDFHVLEIGVHNGFFASMFTRLLNHKSVRYYGIELMRNCYMAVLAQFKLKEVGNNFQVTNAAAGDKEGVAYYPDMELGNGMVVSANNGI
jgi:hypothetical protein